MHALTYSMFGFDKFDRRYESKMVIVNDQAQMFTTRIKKFIPSLKIEQLTFQFVFYVLIIFILFRSRMLRDVNGASIPGAF